jgi:PAS domain S-box-containing protein
MQTNFPFPLAHDCFMIAVTIINLNNFGKMIQNNKAIEQNYNLNSFSNDAKGILLKVLTAVNSSLDIDTLLTNLVQQIGEAINVTSATIFEWDSQKQESSLLALYSSSDANKAESLVDQETMYKYDYAGFSDIINGKQHAQVKRWHVADPVLDRWLQKHMIQFSIKSILHIPLASKNELIGSIELWETRYHREFSADEIALSKAIADQVATALSNAQLYQSELRRRHEAEILNDVAHFLTATLDLDDVMQRTVDTIRQYLNPIHSCTISLIEENGRFLRVVAKWVADPSYSMVEIGSGRQVDETYASQIALHDQKPFVINDIKLHPFMSHHMREGNKKGLRAILYIPLILQQNPIGLLQIHVFHLPRIFTKEEIELCSNVANLATIAIVNARLHAETQQQAKELAILNEVAVETATSTDVDDLIRKTTNLISKSIYTEMFGFVLRDEITDDLVPHISYFGVAKELLMQTIPLERSIVGKVVLTGNHIIIDDVRTEPSYYDVVNKTLSEVAVPVLIDGAVVAVINAESSKTNHFSNKDLRFLNTLAGQVATAMERAKLYNAIRSQAASLGQQVKERTAELQAERDRTLAILESAGEGIIFTNTEAKIQYANQALLRQSGYTIAELINQTPNILNSGQTSETTFENMWRTILAGNYWTGEIINQRKDGTLYNVSLTVTPLFAENGDVSGFVSVHADITRLKEVERLKAEFVSSVTHELRTPLTNIKTYLSLLERGKQEKRARYFEVLKYETERLTRLIQDVLDLSRLESTSFFDTNVSVDPAICFSVLLNGFVAEAAKKEITVQHQIPNELPHVRITKEHFNKVISNLLSNALAYSQSKSVVEICAREERNNVVITIQDSGPGIVEEEIAQIFERFYRGKAARDTNTPGTGLGLSIASDIVERYGGKLRVSSEVAMGSCFQVWLPKS